MDGGLEDAASTQYQIGWLTDGGDEIGNVATVRDDRTGFRHVSFSDLVDDAATGAFHGIQLRTRRQDGGWSQPTRIWFYLHEDGSAQLVRVTRHT